MKRSWFLTGMLFASLPIASWAQQVKIVDKSSLQPIEFVLIYDEEKKNSIQTNLKGEADFSIFGEHQKLIFQHPSYQNYSTTKAEILQQKGVINLTEKVFSTEEVVISANKWEQEKTEIPNEIVKISAKDIATRNPQTAADLLGQTGQVYIQKSQLGGGSPMFRGFNANSVLIMVDGVRMNNAIYRAGNLQNVIMLDGASLESAEVIFGAGSVMYGSDALGGVMDFHTKNPSFATEKNIKAKGSSFLRYSTANKEKTGHIDFSVGGKRIAWLSNITFSDFGDLQAGKNSSLSDWTVRKEYVQTVGGVDSIFMNTKKNLQVTSGYNQFNIIQKLAYKPTNNTVLQYALHYSNSSNIPRFDRLAEYRNGRLRFAEWYYGPQKWIMNSLTFSHAGKNKAYDMMKLTLAHQSVEEQRNDRSYRNDWRNTRTENVAAVSFNADFEQEFTPKHQFFYGAEMVYNYVKSSAFSQNINTQQTRPLDTRYPSGGSEYAIGALYASYKYLLGSTWVFTSGLRYSQIHIQSNFTDTTFFKFPFKEAKINTGALNGSAGVVYKPSTKLQMNLNLATGFRSPNVDDMGKIFAFAPKQIMTPNNNLKPEYTYNAEYGITGVVANRIRLGVTAYYTHITNLIAAQPSAYNGKDSIEYNGVMSKVYTLKNSNSGYIYGMSAQIEGDITSNIGFRSVYNHVYGKDNSTKLRLHAPPAFGTTTLYYKAKKLRLEGYASYQLRSQKFKNLATEANGRAFMYPVDYVPAWFTFNMRASYSFHERISMNIAIENIFDKFYISYGSGIAASGRNISVSLRANF